MEFAGRQQCNPSGQDDQRTSKGEPPAEKRGISMCKECGNCTKEHTKTIDEAIDIVEDSVI